MIILIYFSNIFFIFFFYQEIDVDVVVCDGEVVVMVVFEYVENVGVYFGDVIMVFFL